MYMQIKCSHQAPGDVPTQPLVLQIWGGWQGQAVPAGDSQAVLVHTSQIRKAVLPQWGT